MAAAAQLLIVPALPPAAQLAASTPCLGQGVRYHTDQALQATISCGDRLGWRIPSNQVTILESMTSITFRGPDLGDLEGN